jgi:hypothetical protein
MAAIGAVAPKYNIVQFIQKYPVIYDPYGVTITAFCTMYLVTGYILEIRVLIIQQDLHIFLADLYFRFSIHFGIVYTQIMQ